MALRYEGPERCPRREAFVAQVEARTNRARWVEAAPGVRRFGVELSADDGVARGVLTLRDAAGTEARREIDGQSCEEVVAALALITALAIDPSARTAPIPAAPGPVPGPVPGPTPEPAPTPVPGGPGPGPAPVPAPPAPLPAPVPAPEPPPPRPLPPPIGLWSDELWAESEPAGWRFALGLHVWASSVLGSTLGPVVPIFFDAASGATGLLAPAFRVAFSVMPPRTLAAGGGTASFTRFAGHLSGCPVRLGLYESLALRPCLELELGALRATGSGVPDASVATTPWVAGDVALRLEVAPVDWLLLELDGKASVPFVRPRYAFVPDVPIVAVDPVIGTFGGGAAIRF